MSRSRAGIGGRVALGLAGEPGDEAGGTEGGGVEILKDIVTQGMQVDRRISRRDVKY